MVPFNVLFIDSYDSFTYNVVRLIEKQRIEGYDIIHVTTIRNDTFKDMAALRTQLPYFDCIIVGPGPGDPNNGVDDIGIIASLFCAETTEVPILGICLGFQALCLSHGAHVQQLETIKHGQVYSIEIAPEMRHELFEGYPTEFKSVRYHSLHACMKEDKNTPIIPLAHSYDENGRVLMAARIKEKPWFGVQYHPESCCSQYGDLLIRNFLKIAHRENTMSQRLRFKCESYSNDVTGFNRLLKKLDDTIDHSPIYLKEAPKTQDSIFIRKFDVAKESDIALRICDKIKEPKFIMTSATLSAQRGEWTIIALPNKNSDVLTHYSQINKTTIHKWRDPEITTELLNSILSGSKNDISSLKVLNEDKSHFWITLGDFMKERLISNNPDLPFIGGLVGIFGYEMGYHVFNTTNPGEKLNPDAKQVYIENSIIINHMSGELYCISLSQNFPGTLLKLFENQGSLEPILWDIELPRDIFYKVNMPQKGEYAKAFELCQDYLHKGDSYEVCLTTQTQVIPTTKIPPWRIFKTLIQRNPAPFASFFEFSDLIDSEKYNKSLCLISTSPERFLKWDKDTCELRPIKGTVRKSKDMDLEKATKILKTPKEFGENLMILDLIRNDLYELIPTVNVESFMSVEEYETVYQLVSVVKAYGLADEQIPYTGMDVLRHSLPPGSMTGAPKKITVELLQEKIEPRLNKHVLGGVRGVYSGVTGYWSANGNGDWSVNIRCMYSYESGINWQIGAGGAITVLSTLDGELEEMYTKLESALQIFT